MNYLITGGCGFIGSHMVGRLLQGEQNTVTVFDNLSSGKREFLSAHRRDVRLRIVEGDLLDASMLETVVASAEFVFHFAANADISLGMDHPDLDFNTTVIGTFNLLEAMRKHGVQRIVYSSGSGVYGDQGKRTLTEDFGPLLPVSIYGASKLSAEGMISAYASLNNWRAWIYRFANVVGPRQTHGVAHDFIKKLRDNPQRLEILGDGQQNKSYIHVDDVIDALLLGVERAAEAVNLFNVTTADSVTVDEIAAIVIDAMGLNDVKVMHTGGPGGWPGDVPVIRFSADRIRSLGWTPKRSSAEALRASVAEMLIESD